MPSHTSIDTVQIDVQQVELFQKPVSTLAIIPKTGAITRVGRQAYTIMMLMARDQEADEKGRFSAPVNAIIKGFDGAEGTREELKRHLRSMVTHVIEWQSPTTDESASWVACPLLAEVQLTKRNNENWVTWAYPPTLRMELLSPDRYAQLLRSTISRFKTHAGLALYEICARYKDNPSKLTPRQDWRWWIPVLTGKPASETQKTEFRFFNRDTLKPAVAEVNEVSELNIALIEIKAGRSVDQLQFSVEMKKPVSLDEAMHKPDIGVIYASIELGIDKHIAEELYIKYGDFSFAMAVNKLKEQIQKGVAIASKVAYLRKILANAVKNDAFDSNTTKKSKKKEEGRAGTPQSSSVKEVDSVVPQVVAEQTEDMIRTQLIREELNDLQQHQLDQLLDELIADMQLRRMPKPIIQRVEKRNWQSALVLGELMRFYWRKTRGFEWT